MVHRDTRHRDRGILPRVPVILRKGRITRLARLVTLHREQVLHRRELRDSLRRKGGNLAILLDMDRDLLVKVLLAKDHRVKVRRVKVFRVKDLPSLVGILRIRVRRIRTCSSARSTRRCKASGTVSKPRRDSIREVSIRLDQDTKVLLLCVLRRGTKERMANRPILGTILD
jgi:hypothetical protein